MLHHILHPTFAFDLAYPETDLPVTEQRLQNAVQQLFLPILDEVLTEFGNAAYILKINTLELDLGEIQLADLENEAPYRLRSRLREKLTELIISQQFNLPNAPEIITYEQNALEALSFFFETGRSAWWATSQNYQTLFAEIAQIAPTKLSELIQKQLDSPYFFKRLIYQIPENQLLKWLVRGHTEKIAYIQKFLRQIYQFNQKFWQIPTHILKLEVWRAIIDYFFQKSLLSSEAHQKAFEQAVLQKVVAYRFPDWLSFQSQLLQSFSNTEQSVLKSYLLDLQTFIPQNTELIWLLNLPLQISNQAREFIRLALQKAIQMPDFQAINVKIADKIRELESSTYINADTVNAHKIKQLDSNRDKSASPDARANSNSISRQKLEELRQLEAQNFEFNLPEKKMIALVEEILPQESAELLHFVREIVAKAEWFGISRRTLQKMLWALIISELSSNRYGEIELRKILPRVISKLQSELKFSNIILQNLLNRLNISYLSSSDLIPNPDWEDLQRKLVQTVAQELNLTPRVLENILENYLIDNQAFIEFNEKFINLWFRGVLQKINQQFNQRIEAEKIRQLLINQGLNLAKQLKKIDVTAFDSENQLAENAQIAWREREFVQAIRQQVPLRATWLFELVEQISRLGFQKLEIWQKLYGFVLTNKLFQKKQLYEHLKIQFPTITLAFWQKTENLRAEVQAELIETTYFQQLIDYWEKTEDLLWTEKIKTRLWQNRQSIEELAQKIGRTLPENFAQALKQFLQKAQAMILPQILDNEVVSEYLKTNFKTPTQFINALELFFKNQLHLPKGIHLLDILDDFKNRFPQALNVYFTTLNPLEISLLAAENPSLIVALEAEKLAFAEELKQVQEAILENRFLPDTPETLPEADKIKKIQALKDALKQAQTQRKAWLNEPLYVRNAGLVLLHPYLTRLFTMLQLIENKEFKGFAEACKAVYLLQYLAFKEYQGFEEPDLVLNKLLCGIDLDEPLLGDIELSETEKETCESLLQGVIANWTIMGKTSPDALRNSFLQREGRLSEEKDAWVLRVAQSGVDVLVERLPWGIGTIKLATMKKILTVEWV